MASLRETPQKIRKVSWKVTSSETKGQSVGSGKMAVKVFNNEQASPWVASLNEAIPWLIWLLVCVCLCPIRGQHLSCYFCDLLTRKSLPANSTNKIILLWPHQKNTFIGANGIWFSIILQREICKKPTFISYIFVQNKTLWSCIRHFRGCTSCLACQHFDSFSTNWFSNNLHMSST